MPGDGGRTIDRNDDNPHSGAHDVVLQSIESLDGVDPFGRNTVRACDRDEVGVRRSRELRLELG